MDPSIGDSWALDHERERSAIAAADVCTWEWDVDSGEVWWSPGLEALVGLPAGFFGRTYEAFLALVHASDRDAVTSAIDRALDAETPTEYVIEFRVVGPGDSIHWVATRGRAVFEDGRPVRMHGAVWDISARRRVEEELAAGLRQQVVVAELGRQAATGTDRDALLAETVARIAETLGVEFAEVLEYRPEERALRLRAGVGWRPGLVGQAKVTFDEHTLPSYTLLKGDATIVEDLRTDPRFSGPPWLREHGIVSGLSAVIQGEEHPFGVLGAYTPSPRSFSSADVTFLRAAANVLTAAEGRRSAEAVRRDEYFRALVQHSSDVISVLDADGTIRYVSDAVKRVLGLCPSQLVGTDPFALFHPDDAPSGRRAFADVRAGGRVAPVEARVRHADGTWRWLEIVANDQFAHPGVAGLVVNARDVTERKAFEERLAHQALHDSLTGLPNRALFGDRLAHAMARAAGDDKVVALFIVDLDQFKAINDAFGQEAGDRLLAAVALQLQGAVRPEDTVARLGGDEFAVLVEGVSGPAAAAAVAERLLAALRTSNTEDRAHAAVGASVGIALGAGDATPRDLLRAADSVMHRAKAAGRFAFALFDPAVDAQVIERRALEADLRRAIADGELMLQYQPQVDLTTGEIRGLESLVRWRRPGRGLVPPAQFVSLAEENGLIVPLGRWVLTEACRQTSAWHRTLSSVAVPPVSVNISALELGQDGLAEHVARVLDRTALFPSQLQIEVTESAVMELGEARTALRSLKALGVRVAVDDFGTGYWTLAALLDSHADTLKLDRSFVDDIADDSARQAVVRAVAGLAHDLGMTVVAEGVERSDEVVAVRALGADVGQGYFFSPPAPPAEIAALLQRKAPYRSAIDQATGATDRQPK